MIAADLFVVAVVVLARFLLPLTIPRWPLPGVLLCLIVDGLDQTLFQSFTQFDLSGYQGYDKALDVYYLVIAYLSTLRNWQNSAAFKVSRFLVYYRLLGVVLFELSGWRPLLLIFPNTFEYFFIGIESVRAYWNPVRLSRKTVLVTAAAIWLFIKVPQEWWIHIAEMDVTDSLKGLFGQSSDTSWGEAFAYRPLVLVGLLLTALLAGLAVRFLLIPRLPAPRHALTLAADPLPEDIDEPQEKRAVFARTCKPWHPVTLEKISLIGLVSVTFGQILPGFSASPFRLTISVAVVVSINSAISYWLARHDLGFGHAFKQFGLLLTINASLAALGFIALTQREDPANIANTLFLMLLLTLLVTLYDRFRPVYSARFEKAALLRPHPTPGARPL
jgi:hypothetical protein